MFGDWARVQSSSFSLQVWKQSRQAKSLNSERAPATPAVLTFLDCANYITELKSSSRIMETQATQTSEHVLVIDDDVELCNLVSRFLVREGFQIDAVNGGAQGIERALSGDYALVVLDVMMPEMSGFDVLRRIRAESPMPVLMLTARGDALDRVLGLEMGADDYLPKPFNPPELAARIRAILRRAKPGNAATQP